MVFLESSWLPQMGHDGPEKDLFLNLFQLKRYISQSKTISLLFLKQDLCQANEETSCQQ